MANVISKASLFPEVLTGEMLNLVKGSSALAELSGRTPLSFNGNELFTFTLDKEVDVIGENDAKSNGGATIDTVTISPIKIEYGMRVSDEFLYASEEYQINVLREFAEGFARKAARGLDIMALHGFNPRTGAASGVIGAKNFKDTISQVITGTGVGSTDIESAVTTLAGAGYRPNGIAAGIKMNTALAAETKSNGDALFPELGWGGQPDTLRGLTYRANSTVDVANTTICALVGDFNFFRWGIAREIPAKIIEYGNPDNDAVAGDLQGHNQIYIRAEMYIGWGILDDAAFAIVDPTSY